MSKRSFVCLVFAAAVLACASPVLAKAVPGAPDSNAITIWRYWERNYGRIVEKMMILNNADSDLVLTASGEAANGNGSRRDSLGGPWMIPAKNFGIVNAPANAGGPGDRLQLRAQDDRVIATLSLHSPFPPDTAFRSGVITTEGLNGEQGGFDHCWWHHHSTILRAGDRDTVYLHLMPMRDPSPDGRDARIILVQRDTSSSFHLKLIRLSSEALEPRRMGNDVLFVVPWDEGKDPKSRGFVLTFVVEAPEAADPAIAEVRVWQQLKKGSARLVSLPMLAVP